MPRQPSRAKLFVLAIDNERSDTKRTLEALRLQAKAWRILTMITADDPKRGAEEARWLLMHSFPWVHEGPVRKFIADREMLAEEAGLRAGIFDVSTKAS